MKSVAVRPCPHCVAYGSDPPGLVPVIVPRTSEQVAAGAPARIIWVPCTHCHGDAAGAEASRPSIKDGQMRWTAGRKAEILEQYRAGDVTLEALDADHGISLEELQQWGKLYDARGHEGLKATKLRGMVKRRARGQGEPVMIKRPKEELAAMERLRDQGMTYAAIGRRYGLSGETIRRALGRKPTRGLDRSWPIDPVPDYRRR